MVLALGVCAVQAADLAITKSIPDPADNPLAATDDSLTYRLTVTNRGPDDATDITVEDTLSAWLNASTGVAIGTNTIPGLSCSSTGNQVTCNGGALANGTSGYVDITLTRPLKDGTISNTATVDSRDIGDPIRSNNSATISSVITPVADLEVVTKTVNPATVKAGVEATYVITVRNNGPSAAADVAVSDSFSVPSGDSGFTFVSAAASNAGSCSGLSAGDSHVGKPALNCTWPGSVASGATRTVTVKLRPNWMAGSAQRQLDNEAVVSTTTHDANAANDSKSARLLIDPAQVDMLVNVTDAAAVGAGPDPLGYNPLDVDDNMIVYRVTATNNGPSYASGVTLTNVFTPPAGKRYTFLCDNDTAPASARQCDATTAQCDNVNVSYNSVAATITCNAPTGLDSGDGYVRFLAFRIESAPGGGGDVYRLQSTVDRNEDDSNAANDTADETSTVRVRADLVLTKAASVARVSLFEPFTWTMTVHNKGPGDSLITTLTDTLPAGMEFTGANPVTPSQGSCSVTGTQFSCDLGTVANGANATATARVRHTVWPSGGSVTNTARVTTSEVDPTTADNTATGTVTLVRSSLAGVVYFDRAGNGVPDAGDTGIAGVTLQLSGADAWGNPVARTTTTDVDGNYRFVDLPPSGASGYTVTQTQPTGYHSVHNAAGSAGGDTSVPNVISNVALAAGERASGYDFGNTQNSPTSIPLLGPGALLLLAGLLGAIGWRGRKQWAGDR